MTDDQFPPGYHEFSAPQETPKTIVPVGYYESTGDIIQPKDTIVKASEGVHYVKYNKWWDTKTVTQMGMSWLENKFYCPFPEDTKAYDEYWDEQEHYIMNGYIHEGLYVPGLEYLYLNFCPIWNKREKKHQPPDFRVTDVDWFNEIEQAMGIGRYRNESWVDTRPPVHITAKTRQSGHSLKGVVPLLYNLHWVPGSQNYLGAYQKTQAQKTNKRLQYYRNHLMMHTAWGKGYLRKTEGENYLIGYMKEMNGQWIDAGFLSYLGIVGFADGFPEKAVGGGIDLFVLEEIGIFPGLGSAINFILPALKDGDITTGNILGFGAAGSLEKAADLQKIAYDPITYKCWAYDNIWAKNEQDRKKKVVYFVPNYSCRPPYIDADGNPDPEKAIAAKELDLADKKKKDYEDYMEALSQSPNTLEEMFAIRKKTRFSKEIWEPQLRFLEAHKGEFSFTVDLWMDPSTNKVEKTFVDREPIHEWPIDFEKISPERKEGVVEIFEWPPSIPAHGVYIASIDSYNQEDTTGDSAGCIQIFKKQVTLSGEGTGRVLVAEYVARPKSKLTFYRNCLYLLLLYNAKCMPENEDQELVPWFYNQGFDYLLADQPDIILSYIPDSKTYGKRAKGIHAAWPLIKAAENKIQRYGEETLGTIYHPETGSPVGIKYGSTRMLSLGTCREIVAYVSDPESVKKNKKKDLPNFDRVRCLGWVLMYEEETLTEAPEDQENDQMTANFLNNTNRLGTTSMGLLPNTPVANHVSNTFKSGE